MRNIGHRTVEKLSRIKNIKFIFWPRDTFYPVCVCASACISVDTCVGWRCEAPRSRRSRSWLMLDNRAWVGSPGVALWRTHQRTPGVVIRHLAKAVLR